MFRSTVVPLLSLAGISALAAGCARPEPPRGGPEDRLPPIVVETVPDTFATVADSIELREFHFRFSERISERPSAGTMDDAVVVSPSAGNVRVSHGRDGIRVRTQDALLPGRVYRITVLPVVRDMFGNELPDPFDLVVSTGGEFVPNVVAGVVEDRVTGQAVEGVRVQARFLDEEGTPVHWNYTGRQGVFSLRYVPSGSFEARAWQDRNRNDTVDAREPLADWRRGELAAPADTGLMVLSLIEPDTTGARLASVTAEDSVTLRFEFDDYLNPCVPGIVIEGFARWEETEGDTLSEAVRIFHEHEHRRWQAQRADSIARAAAGGEGEDQPPPSPPSSAPGGCTAGENDPSGLSGQLLPSQALVGVLEEWRLNPGTPYLAGVTSVGNIAGAASGEAAALVVWEPAVDSAAVDSTAVDSTTVVTDSAAAAADTTQADSVQALPDTTQALPDTVQVDSAQALPDTTQVDTTQVLPDTTQAPPDTVQALPDTTQVPPDTAQAADTPPPDTSRLRFAPAARRPSVPRRVPRQ